MSTSISSGMLRINLLTMYVEFCSLATFSLTVGGSNSVCSIIFEANVRDVKFVNLFLYIFCDFSMFCIFNFLSIFSPKSKELQI
jgi:hypothetical protein